MAQPKIATIIRQLGLSQTLAAKADQRAAQLGLSTPEYLRYLIVQDQPALKAAISPAAEQKYLRDGDTFSQLVNSQAFEAHKQATLALFHKDPSRFVDPFETYQKNA